MLLRLIPLLLFLPFAAAAQGTHFEHGLSWAEVQARAKTENKYILVDCYTTWCGPCRYMSTTIFPTPEAGAFFNDKFISVAVQLDTTARDDREVRRWYTDAHALISMYDIHAYPTYLVFNSDGEPLHRMVGARQTAAAFINEVSEAFDSTKAYYSRLRQFSGGRRDSLFLYRAAMSQAAMYDRENGLLFADAFLQTQNDPFSRGSLEIIMRYNQGSGTNAFTMFIDNTAKIDSLLGAGIAEMYIDNVLIKEFAGPQIRAAGNLSPDWERIRQSIAVAYPGLADEVAKKVQVQYYQQHNDWRRFQNAVVLYMLTYGVHASANELNQYARAVFENCKDMSCVSEALEWSKRSLGEGPNARFMDTYANILYKLGKTQDAIAWEEKAADLARGSAKAGFEAVLDKMKKGEKTWN